MRLRDDEAGITLTEITIVFVLASLVMTGLLAFYLNSQAVWVDGSTQAIAQREVTLVLNAVSARARRATGATVTANPDLQHVQIALKMPGAPPESTYFYWWSPADSLVHEGYRNLNQDRGPMIMSRVECFAASADSFLLSIDSLRVHSSSGAHITLNTAAAFENRGAH
jgi:hypothetical protein